MEAGWWEWRGRRGWREAGVASSGAPERARGRVSTRGPVQWRGALAVDDVDVTATLDEEAHDRYEALARREA